MERRNYDKVKQFNRLRRVVSKRHATLHSKKYVTAKFPITITCKNSHKFTTNFDRVVGSGKWCPVCGIQKRIESRLKRKGLKYLREICLGRGFKCLSSEYAGVKVRVKWFCLKCKNTWRATPDNISQGKGCPKCVKGMGRVINPKQRGALMTIPKGAFFRNSPSIITRPFTQVQVTGPIRLHYEKRGYDVAKINSPLWVRTSDLPSASNLVIESRCRHCHKISKRSLNAILRTKACSFCCGGAIGDALRGDKKRYEDRYGVKIRRYNSFNDVCEVIKPCGCVVLQSMGVARLTGIQYCRHDSEKTWRSFEIFIRNALNAEKGNTSKHGVAVDCVTNNFAIEVKLNVAAVHQNFGRRSPKDAIRRYRHWARRTGRKFFVVVNESQNVLRNARLPRYYLGWEKWHQIGLTKRDVSIGRRFKLRPHEFRSQVLSKYELSDLIRYRQTALALGRLPTAAELKAQTGLSYAYISRLAIGRTKASIAEIGAALNLGLKTRNSTKKDRKERIDTFRNACLKAGYRLNRSDCRELCGTSLHNIMYWVLGPNRFSMSALEEALGVPGLRRKRVALN